jgi:hypothetical protein
MRRSEETVDLAAQARGKSRICDRCFAEVAESSTYCPECGAPLAEGADSDVEVHPDLAKANLLRMRGEFAAAEEACLQILKRLPNNASAHTLLGDVCQERGDLEQAAQWFELALDLNPSSVVDQQKLESVRIQLEQKDEQGTAEQLGLPEVRPKTGWYAAGILAILAVVGAGGFMLGLQRERPTPASPLLETPPVIARPQQFPNPPTETIQEEPREMVATPLPAVGEADLLQRMRAENPDAGALQAVVG